MTRKHIIILTICLFNFTILAQEINIKDGWKFKTGDSMQWASPDYNDADWKNIELNRTYEFQGFENYDGYSWYRKKLFLPSSLKKNSQLKDSLKLLLGIIDDHDQVFLNGQKIGENGGKTFVFGNNNNNSTSSGFNISRNYKISVNHPAIRWDKENVIAVRVYDQVGDGGMLEASEYTLSMVDVLDFVTLDISAPFIFRNDGSFSKSISLNSSSETKTKFTGKLIVEIIDMLTKETKATYSINASFDNSKPFQFEFTHPKCENYEVHYSFLDSKTGNGFSEQQEIPYLLTPAERPEPKINAAKVFGVRPNSPVLFKIPATGQTPLIYQATGLPKELALDSKTGIISGKFTAKGQYNIKLKVSNALGYDVIDFKIICGDGFNLTPQMGWNSWNCWGLAVSTQKVMESANAMIDKGLINYGWSYMNIDDGWEDKRDAKGVLQPNEKFPDIKKLCTDIHNMGLKIGIYSSPGPKTCGGFEGSYKYEDIDAQTWADWGIDYLKYDLCSYNDLPEMRKNLKYNAWIPIVKTPKEIEIVKAPYAKMQKSLQKINRDITYSLCQYGIGDVWKWGGSVGGNSWRTTGDITDTWRSMAEIGFSQYKISDYAKPGNWNDPDMLVVGRVGWGPKLRNSRLTCNEQYTHISLWAMLASPLLIGCDMSQLDDFTLNLLKNSEVIAINQDELGKQAQRIVANAEYQVWVKELADGSKAMAIFNISEKVQNIKIKFTDLGMNSSKSLRDIWKQTDLGQYSDFYELTLPSHGVKMLKCN